MPKNNSSQISIFIDKYVKFKISNENYSIDYKDEEITFSELESIIESNLKYWEEKSLESEMCIEIRNIWNVWHESIKDLKNYLEEEDELTKEKLYTFIYNNITSSYKLLSEELRLYTLNIDSPTDKDSGIAMIRMFIDYYLNSWAEDDLSDAILNYVSIEKDKSQLGSYLNSRYNYNFIPALFVLNKEIRKEDLPFKDFQKEVVKPVSEKVEKIDSQINDKFKETTNLIEEKDKDIINLFDEHKNEIDEFKTKINEWRDDKEKQIETLEETYKSKLQLEAPETLWESRAAKYRIKSRWWMGGLLFFIIGLLVSSGYFVISIHDYLQGTVKEIPFISKSFIYVALISFLIYIIRIIIKIIVSSQHMSMEYEQKAALTRFYQALIQDGKEVDKEEKLIIFNALFRKTDTGLIKSDNSNDADALLSQFSKLGK
ncbi:DUF6161 domain-containing protein [Gemella haemolysans]|uniref:DUF6161 domain-containing protein n=1 Tax=Gemella haemolysans ATCC 10379 TaxID=546270 RepID=C5NVI4_9BACL|nr:DUF6161 domain-containing protein [Gemella haemolysans]EER68717.1 hypothetical protein GEMHA0001_0898 [Gemella haemolysans ATCC 10379]KAA8708311.1 hypothetical protein F4V11_03525 [Gemella haemolysans]UBH82391.1 hypothetical protein LA340_00060 [Gemella haemolysans]VEI39371.1 Uncharacterised protein [Gemella haemolysans]